MQLKEIEKLAASVMEKAVDAKEVAGVNLLVLKAGGRAYRYGGRLF